MTYACVYTTRTCQNHCTYCSLRDAKLRGPELTPAQWCGVTTYLANKVDFALFLGNECWKTVVAERGRWGKRLVQSRLPYAMYTSLSMPERAGYVIDYIGIDNVSVGVDYPLSLLDKLNITDDSIAKSFKGMAMLVALKKSGRNIDLQATCTISAKNYMYLQQLIDECQENEINLGLNFIHFNVDGCFDFFPMLDELPDWKLTDDMLGEVTEIILGVNPQRSFIQNLTDMQSLLTPRPEGVGSMNNCWHCQGDPYGGPSIDADGFLRCCGYRKGLRTNRLHIWDLMLGRVSWDTWKATVKEDAMECPGCTWSYPRLYAQYKGRNENFGIDVVQRHARLGETADEEQKRSFRE